MNWQEVVNGNQQQAKTNMNNQLGGAIPYMPLIFNQQNPAGAALGLALGNLINDAIGRRNDAHNVSRFANAKDGVDKQFAINTAPTQQTGTGLLGSATQGEEQAELTEEQQAAQAEANRNAMLNNVRAIRSSGDYYNALVDAAVRNGASRAKAMDWAAKEAGMYQDRANKAYQDVLNQYGYSEDGALNNIGTEMASLMTNEGRGDYAKTLLNTSATPKDSLTNRWAREREERAFEREIALRSMFGGGRVGSGGSGGGSRGVAGGSSPVSYYNDDGSFNYGAFVSANRLSTDERDKRLKSLNERLSNQETDENGNVIQDAGYRADKQEYWFIRNRMDRLPRNPKEAWSWITKMRESGLFTDDEIQSKTLPWLTAMSEAGLMEYDGQANDLYESAGGAPMTVGDEAQKQEFKESNDRLREGESNTDDDNRDSEYVNGNLLGRWVGTANNNPSKFSADDWKSLINSYR